MKDSCSDEIKKLCQLTDEMENLTRLNEELEKKCIKLEDKNVEYKKRLLDQSNIMKSLNVRIFFQGFSVRHFYF